MSERMFEELDISAIDWTGNHGKGVAGNSYEIAEVTHGGRLMLVGGRDIRRWDAGVPIGDRNTLLAMLGRRELLHAAMGNALRSAPTDLLSRAAEILSSDIMTLDSQLSCSEEGYFEDDKKRREIDGKRCELRKLVGWGAADPENERRQHYRL